MDALNSLFVMQSPDIRQHLGIDTEDPEAVLQTFIERQRAVGAIRESGDGGA